jgi:flagellar biosynthetic protein FliR
MITLSVSWVSALYFVMLRIATVCLMSPIQAIKQLPLLARFLLTFSLSMLLLSHLPLPDMPQDNLSLLLGSFAEISNGLLLGLSIQAAFAVFHLAGSLIDNQMGLNALSIFNPTEHHQAPLTSHVLSLFACVIFFTSEAHHQLLLGLTYSFQMLPPGQSIFLQGVTPLMYQVGMIFIFAILLASPVVLSLLLIDVAGAVLTRNMPQVSIYFLTLPIKILLGFFLMQWMFDAIKPLLEKLFAQIFTTWQMVLS